ncbi:response regulator [Winogradskyella sp.]|uniref:response regulator transcription factor n=1 Tax=Winogradskyella sp. TaxID=1883156 RepID=UPI003BAB91BF
MIKVVIADDHTIFRQGLYALLDKEDRIELVGEAKDGKEVLEILAEHAVDVLLLDIEMPRMDGFDTMRVLKKQKHKPKILVLTMHASPQFIKNIFANGADGYLPKDAEKAKLMEAINTVYTTGSYHTPDTVNIIMNTLKGNVPSTNISAREKEIIKLIADQYTTNEIAEKLFLSTHTVESHRKNILLKLGLKNTAGLVKYAIQKGLI